MGTDYGQIGNSLRQRDVQYVANRDEYGVWRILDTWSREMAAMTLTQDLDIPDDSDAVTILTEGQFLALMKEVEQQKYMPAATVDNMPFEIASEGNDSYSTEALQTMTEERNDLRKLVDRLQKELSINNSADNNHELSMRKLALLETMSNKGNLELEIAELLNSVGE